MPDKNTREKIKSTAARLFAEYGYDNSSVRKITDEAGVNLGAVNYHFRSKDELFRAIIVDFMEQLESVFEPIHPAESKEEFRQVFSDFLQSFMDLCLSDVFLVTLFFTEQELVYTKCLDVVEAKVGPIRQKLLHFISKAQEDGIIDRDISADMAAGIIFNVIGDEVRRIRLRQRMRMPHLGESDFQKKFMLEFYQVYYKLFGLS